MPKKLVATSLELFEVRTIDDMAGKHKTCQADVIRRLVRFAMQEAAKDPLRVLFNTQPKVSG